MYGLHARYLNPNTGRFWTMDSYEGSTFDPLTLHKYLYCHDLINEASSLTYQTCKEHAVISLKSGERALVSGGENGIIIAKDQVKRVIGHNPSIARDNTPVRGRAI